MVAIGASCNGPPSSEYLAGEVRHLALEITCYLVPKCCAWGAQRLTHVTWRPQPLNGATTHTCSLLPALGADENATNEFRAASKVESCCGKVVFSRRGASAGAPDGQFLFSHAAGTGEAAVSRY